MSRLKSVLYKRKQAVSPEGETACVLPDIAIRYCRWRWLGRRGFHCVAETIDQVIDGEQFGFAVGHAQLDAVFGLDDEVVGALDFLGREGVDILGSDLGRAGVDHPVLFRQCRGIDLAAGAVLHDHGYERAVVTLLVHSELSCLIVKDCRVCPKKGAKREIGPGGSIWRYYLLDTLKSIPYYILQFSQTHHE